MSLLLVPLNLKRGIIYALLTLAEASWLAAILHAVTTISGKPASWFLTLLAGIASAILLGWLTDVYQFPMEFTRGVGMALAALVWLMLLNATLYPNIHFWQLRWLGQFVQNAGRSDTRMTAVWLGAAVGYIWWRCLFLGHTPPELPIARPTMVFGTVGFIVSLFLGSLQSTLSPSLGLLLLFVCGSLLALSLSHTQTIAEFHGDAAMGRWRVRVLNGSVTVAVVLVSAIVLGSIFSLPLLDRMMGLVWLGLGYILKPLTAVFIWLLMKLGQLIEAIINWLRSIAATGTDIAVTPTAAAPAPPPVPIELTSAASQSVWWAKYTVWVWRAAAAAMVIWLFYRLTGGLRERYRPHATHHNIASESGSATADVSSPAGWFAAGKKRLGEWVRLIRQFGIGRELHAAATIRRIYAALMVLAAQHGLQRAESQTPLEFLAVMQTEWQSLAEPLTVVTHAYINVHYGQLPEDAAGLGAVKQAWETVLSALEDGETG